MKEIISILTMWTGVGFCGFCTYKINRIKENAGKNRIWTILTIIGVIIWFIGMAICPKF